MHRLQRLTGTRDRVARFYNPARLNVTFASVVQTLFPSPCAIASRWWTRSTLANGIGTCALFPVDNGDPVEALWAQRWPQPVRCHWIKTGLRRDARQKCGHCHGRVPALVYTWSSAKWGYAIMKDNKLYLLHIFDCLRRNISQIHIAVGCSYTKSRNYWWGYKKY